LHGHEGKVQIFLTGDGLDNTGMVTDFRHLEWLKTWINKYVDHQFILDMNDPLYVHMVGDKNLIPIYVTGTEHVAGYHLDLSDLDPGTPEFEYYEGFMIVDFVPTSEKLSEWMLYLVDRKMWGLGVTVQRVEWWETPKSRSVYYNDNA
jgi:6-pyruvoyltetrahydropterin/6-carboxytetrahydropterin synthase